MATERDSKGHFLKGHSFGKRFEKGCKSWNKGKHYSIETYNLSEEGKKQKIKNLGDYAKRLDRKSINKKGYVIAYAGNSKTKQEHRLIVEKYLGRKLNSDEIIHHIDNNKQNNVIENLSIFDNATHTSLHRQGLI